MKYIEYNINKNYLKHWSLENAIREIMQNFLDYGDYEFINSSKGLIIKNTFEPEDLTFLSIGMSKKLKSDSIGKYGEGLKMAMMIFTREGYSCTLKTNGYKIKGLFKDSALGETFALSLDDTDTKGFEFYVNLEQDIITEYYTNKMIQEKDIIFTHPSYGSIVDKKPGSIFCGGLFVGKVDGLKKAYDFKPSQLTLDRDRQTPKVFDVNYNASMINERQGKLEAQDLSYNDNQYVSSLPTETMKKFEPRPIGDDIKFIYTDNTGKEAVLENENATNIMKSSSFFSDAIKKIKGFIVSKLGLMDMLLDFQKKHVHTTEATEDFNLILERFDLEIKN